MKTILYVAAMKCAANDTSPIAQARPARKVDSKTHQNSRTPATKDTADTGSPLFLAMVAV
jgi:hypothetical protein